MDEFEHKSIATKPYNLTYSYYLSPNFKQRLNPGVPTLVFAHGFPDDAHMWADAMPHMLELPYPIILLDLLGFGGSSKPTDPSKYNWRQQSDSIAQVLDNEKVPNNVIPIGHDWGSAISQRFFLYHRERCIGLSLLSVAYLIPRSEPLDLQRVNEAATDSFGYPQLEYWNFFTAPDAPELIVKNLERFYEVNNGLYLSQGDRDIWMREMFCTPNAMREYITGTGKYKDYTVPLKPYRNIGAKKRYFVDRLGKSGMEGPVCYYHIMVNNTMLEDERALSQSADKKIDVPLLYIGQTGDWVCRTDRMSVAKESNLVPDLEERTIEAGHWCLYEKPEEIAAIFKDWLTRRFPVDS